MTEEVKTDDTAICQNCKHHRNSPSYCKLKSEYKNRKGTCDEFKRK